MLKNILLVVLGVFVLLFLIGTLVIKNLANSPGFAEMKPPPPVLKEPLPSPLKGVQAVSLSGGDTITLNSEEGLAFLNFWALWCRPCLVEMPTIEKLYQAQKDKMEFYVIATEGHGNQLRTFLERKGYSFPAYRLVKTPETETFTSSLPLSMLSHNSKLRIYHRGAANWNSKAVHELVEELADGPSGEGRNEGRREGGKEGMRE